jgi:methylated-DNA-[protein]-cysteine S-methyltransferase
MGAVAGERGIRRVVLPHYQMDDLLALLAWEHQGAARNPDPFAEFVECTRAYFNARPEADFSAIECDLPDETAFFGLVYRAAREIPYGQTLSYSGLAKQIGRPDAARAVATAMSKNPVPLIVPCHRVTYADGSPGGFSAPGGEALKQRMLAMESKSAG